MAHYKDPLVKYGQIDQSTKIAMAPKVTSSLLSQEQKGETHAERILAKKTELKGLVEAPLGLDAGGEAPSLAST
ncbi:hypothetical protein FOA52_002859 [Chlamydomonas sp. UWO 241]|nr:hypothetical protein FOA52_002859 [Chlamydomonas sp. UWO 241]